MVKLGGINISNTDESNNKSSELLLSVVQKEFEYESERNKGIQNRAGIFMSFIGVIMTIFPSYININEIASRPNETIGQTGLLLLYISLIILLFVGLIVSLVMFVTVLNTKQYRKLNSSGFSEENCIYDTKAVSLELMKDYKEILEYNSEINNKKAKAFEMGCKILVACIILIPIIISIKAFI